MGTPDATEVREAGSPGADRPSAPPAAAWAGGWMVILGLAVWVTQLSVAWLVVAGAGSLLWAVWEVRARGAWAPASLALWLLLGLAAGVQTRLGQIAGSWPALQSEIEERAAAALGQELEALVVRGEEAVEGAARAAGSGAQAFARLDAVRRETGVSALVVFDSAGSSAAWAGEHRGTVPPEARRGERSYLYHEGPLFSYVYFVRPLEGGRTAAAAVLLEANLEVGEGITSFTERFAASHGLVPRFWLPEQARGETVWDWSTDRPILSVTFGTLTQQAWWERVVERGRWAVGIAWILALVLLSAAWYRGRGRRPVLPVMVATLALVVAPLGTVLGLEPLFSPLQFVLPIPWDVTLGTLLVLLLGTATGALMHRGGDTATVPIPLGVRVALAPLVFVFGIWLVQRSAAAGMLASQPGGGFALQLATGLLIAVPLFPLLLVPVAARPSVRARVPLLLLALLLGVVAGVAVAAAWEPASAVPVWTGALWGLPTALLLLALPHFPRRRRALRAWLLAGWLAGTASLGHLWPLHMAAQLADAERELALLGTEADPFLDFLLRQFADRASFYAEEGESGVNLLYHSWVESGLAREGHEERLIFWERGRPEAELGLSALGALPPVVPAMVDEAVTEGAMLVRRFTDLESLHYLLVVPLPEGRAISVEVPPRRTLGRATPLARFLHPASDTETPSRDQTLELLPLEAGAAEAEPPGGRPRVEWTRLAGGWRSEALARFPSGWMHAHLLVRTQSYPLLVVRALLVLASMLGVFGLLWATARALCGEMGGLPPLRSPWLVSFRGRLTATLLVFFLVPTAVFGGLAYGAVAREVVRSAASLAQRALEQASVFLQREPLAVVGAELGTDLLLYRGGTLENATAREVLDLGLFHTWLPPEVYLRFAGGEDVTEVEERRLAENDYLVAYRRLDPAVVLAAPIPLASQEIRRRQQEFADIALLMSLLGIGLSVVLSLMTGRALARPLDELSRAAATVGAGDLRVRLPRARADEFGNVYRAFNRMVQRLRSARAALLRETRRTETIVAEAATGVLALDAERRVELVNPRANEILGGELVRGSPLPHGGAVLGALARAVDELWSSGEPERSAELDLEGRIVRLRMRRLAATEGGGGAVVALEDVTREVRSARVLAWGEMARQVAHEIKNPLTPIRLAVQHLRRAYGDGRPDFSQILERNVDAILREIDRLGEIARAFSRFGSPGEASDALHPVDVGRAVEETLAIYRGTGEGIRYRVEVEPDLPPVVARTGELKEVLVNLLENAREAVDGDGEIRVSARSADAGARVELSVSDNGEGIPSDLLPRIFEPHFSTRTSGTGLGLAIVRRLVEAWGGEVTVESQPAQGTRFRIWLRAGPDGGH